MPAVAEETRLEELRRWAEAPAQDPYGFHPDSNDLPDLLFNREIVWPDSNPHFQKGAIGVRCGGWPVAALPWHFRDLDIEEIVSVLWPDLAGEAEYDDDSEADLHVHAEHDSSE